MTKERAIYLLRQVLEFEFEELDTYEFPNAKKWACYKFQIDKEEMKEIFKEDKKNDKNRDFRTIK